MPVPTNWHPGEIAAQQARGFEDAVWGGWELYQEGTPEWMTLFLTQLPFLSVTTIDKKGRPWSTILHNDGNLGFIQPKKDTENHLFITIKAMSGLPIRDCLLDLHEKFARGESAFDQDGVPKIEFLMAGVGIMLNNRRRNKLESVIVAIHTIPKDETEDQFVFEIQTISTYGNCPKYINTRILEPTKEQQAVQSTVHSSSYSGQDLPKEVLNLIESADSLYLATRYSGNDPSTFSPDPAKLGNNHRGGPPGFLRTFWDEERERRCLILPDWSGNRLMMSFGNITKDPFAGFSIPIWQNDQSGNERSSVIYATCSAQVLAKEEIQDLMRGVNGAVKMWIEDWTFAKNTIPIYAKSPNDIKNLEKSNVGWSPYNPPVRLLKSEQSKIGISTQSKEIRAEMINAHFWSESVATFTFSVNDREISSKFKPGQHIVIDCYDALDTRLTMYAHMAQFKGGEKDLNDDGTRSWTIAYASPSTTNSWQFEIVLRRKDRGGVTPTLFRIGKYISEALEEGMKPPPFKTKMNVLGLDGSSFLPVRKATSSNPLQLVYLLSGIGLTPILSHLSSLAKDGEAHANILIILATRKNEAGIMQNIIRNAISRDLTSNTIDKRLNIKLILLISNTELEDESKGVDDLEQEDEGWESLPKDINVEVTQLQGKRITPLSFVQTERETSNEFILSSSDAKTYMESVDMALICAAQKFTKVAQESLIRAGVREDVQHIESFSF